MTGDCHVRFNRAGKGEVPSRHSPGRHEPFEFGELIFSNAHRRA